MVTRYVPSVSWPVALAILLAGCANSDAKGDTEDVPETFAVTVSYFTPPLHPVLADGSYAGLEDVPLSNGGKCESYWVRAGDQLQALNGSGDVVALASAKSGAQDLRGQSLTSFEYIENPPLEGNMSRICRFDFELALPADDDFFSFLIDGNTVGRLFERGELIGGSINLDD